MLLPAVEWFQKKACSPIIYACNRTSKCNQSETRARMQQTQSTPNCLQHATQRKERWYSTSLRLRRCIALRLTTLNQHGTSSNLISQSI